MRYFLAALVMLAGTSTSAFAGVTVAVPEPASMGLLALGAGAVVLARFWRK